MGEHVGPLVIFDRETMGFGSMVSDQINPRILSKATLEFSTSQGWLAENIGELSKKIMDEEYAHRYPLFVPVLAPTGEPIGSKINQLVVPKAFEFEANELNAGRLTHGAKSYVEAEELTGGDSYLYGIVAAAVSDTKNRAGLFALTGAVICEAFQELDQMEIETRMSQVYDLLSVWYMSGEQGRSDLFPGFNSEQPEVAQELYFSWSQNWKKEAGEIKNKILEKRELKLEDIKMIEVLSHMFDVDKMLADLPEILSQHANAENKEEDLKNKDFIEIFAAGSFDSWLSNVRNLVKIAKFEQKLPGGKEIDWWEKLVEENNEIFWNPASKKDDAEEILRKLGVFGEKTINSIDELKKLDQWDKNPKNPEQHIGLTWVNIQGLPTVFSGVTVMISDPRNNRTNFEYRQFVEMFGDELYDIGLKFSKQTLGKLLQDTNENAN